MYTDKELGLTTPSKNDTIPEAVLTEEDKDVIEFMTIFYGITEEQAYNRFILENYDGFIFDEYLEDLIPA